MTALPIGGEAIGKAAPLIDDWEWREGMLVSWTLDEDDERCTIRLIRDVSDCHPGSAGPVWSAVSLAGEHSDYELLPGLSWPDVDDPSGATAGCLLGLLGDLRQVRRGGRGWDVAVDCGGNGPLWQSGPNIGRVAVLVALQRGRWGGANV